MQNFNHFVYIQCCIDRKKNTLTLIENIRDHSYNESQRDALFLKFI
jgi:hypothetical protein